jgi:LPS-assembly lipoprotein
MNRSFFAAFSAAFFTPALHISRGRKRLTLWASAGLFGLLLAGCGFHLRGSDAQFNLPFKTVYLAVAENSPLGIELARNLRGNGQTEVVRERKNAQAIIEVLAENRDKAILSLNFQGRVREYTLTYVLRFQVRDAKGAELLAPNEIALKRTISFNESQVLAKEAEETLLYRDMQTDLVQQIIRRLATIKLASGG